MNNHEPNDKRLADHLVFTDSFWRIMSEGEARPASRIVSLSNSRFSLGSRGEDHLAELAHIPTETTRFSIAEVRRSAEKLSQLATPLDPARNARRPRNRQIKRAL